MMLLKIHFNDDEIARFFEANGFNMVPHKKGKFEKAYHNRSEWVEYEVQGIMVNGRTFDAAEVFEHIAEFKLKQMLTPANLETKRAIERTIKKMRL
jgi:uncharacterized NAD-dependent epimerase/dehydratase family protein